MKRLIILPNNLGDVIMAAPLFEALKRKHPSDELHFLVETGYEGGVVNNPFIDTIHLFPRSYAAAALRDASTFAAEVRSLAEQMDALDSIGFDQVINFSQHPTYATLTSLISAKETIGMTTVGEGIDVVNGYWSRYLFSIPYGRHYNFLHAIDVYKKIAGVDNDPAEPRIYLSNEERKLAKAWLESEGWDGEQKLAVFQPGAAIASKMWGASRFVELGEKLISDGYRILITGAPSEVSLCKTIASELGEKAILSTGKTRFRESISFISFASFVVTGDTAMMHASAALEIPTYALFGSTSPVETGPYGSGHSIFITESCENPPCFKHSCEGENCLDSIPAEVVYNAVNGGESHYKTVVENGQYSLIEGTKPLSRYVTQPDARNLYDLLNGVSSLPKLTESNREDLSEMERLLTLSLTSLSHFQQGDNTAYERYAGHIQKIADFRGFAEPIAALINIGLNSIPLTDMDKGVSDMVSQLHSTILRLRGVLNV